MALSTVVLITGAVVFTGIVLTSVLCLDRSHLAQTREEYRDRIRILAPYFAITALFFVLKRFTHEPSVQLSEQIGIESTATLYAIEGEFVAWLQSITPEFAYTVFSGFYMFGFSYLLLVPLVLYTLTPAIRELKELLVAYMLNYLIGQICYTLFIAYGPRVYLSTVEGKMYNLYPQTQDLTGAVSANTDVFPSLHTSLTVVVLLFAWQTRDVQPRWFPVAAVVTTGVVVSTMTLGIHWLVDVLAGLLLAVGTVAASKPLVARAEGEPFGSFSLRSTAGRGSSAKSDD